jgi:Reverse transcriptase (RNA-dependent DNA polymerase)
MDGKGPKNELRPADQGCTSEGSKLVRAINIQPASRHVPLRWQTLVEIMLEKKKGVHLVDKLRCVGLFEADCNNNNKLMGTRMMKHAEEYNLLATEQYGSRKNRAAITQCLNKNFTTDLVRQLRQPAGLLSNDAKACYDRCVHSFASLALQRIGVPIQMIQSSFTTIQQLKHYIRTVYGESIQFTGGEEVGLPVNSICQGNGAGPAIWAAVSTPIFEMMRHAGNGAQFCAAINGDAIMLVGFAFVDDTDLMVNHPTNDNSSTGIIQEKMQRSITDWEGGLRITGGALEPSKSWWYLINFQWEAGSWRYMKIDECQAEVSVRDPYGKVLPLERVQVNDARKTLGVYLAPNGDNTAEFEYLLDKAKTWQDRVWAGFLPRYAAWEAMSAGIMKTMEYPLAVTCFTPKQCHALTTPILQAGLPNSGVVRTFPRALVHGPISRQGLGIPKLHITQGVQHLLICLSYGNKPEDPTGFLLRASCQQLQLELGARKQFWDLDYNKWAHLANTSWVKHTWQFISDNGLQLQTDLPTLQYRRHNDLYLMDIFINSAKYSPQELQQLNWCRIYLQVITVADITDARGHRILHHIWQGNKETQPRAQYAWPNQGKPSRQSWIAWRAALARTLGMTPTRPNYNCNLGDWTTEGQAWQWHYSPQEERLYEQDNGQWFWYPRAPGQASRQSVNRFRYNQRTRILDTPTQLQRATIIRFRDTITLISYSPAQQPAPPVRRATTFLQHLQEAHPSVAWAFQQIECTGPSPDTWLPHAIQSGTCIAVSDGSFKDGISTASIIIVGDEHNLGRIRLRCRIPGQQALQDSYRAELGGLYSGCQVISHAARYFNLTGGNVTLGCDGLGVKSCFGWRRQSANFPSHDLVMAIQHTFALHPGIHWGFQHIKGHQDDVQGAELDRWALLNIACDLDAKAYREEHKTDPAVNDQPIMGAPWALFDSDKNKYLSDLQPKLQELLGIQAAEQYWDNRHRFQDGSSNDIDWIATGGAMKAFPRKVQREVSKHASGHFATKTKLFYWKQAADKLCPRCKTAIEDATHVHLCTHHTNIDAWELALEELEVFLSKKNTCQEIQDIILLRLRQWALQQPYTPYTGRNGD